MVSGSTQNSGTAAMSVVTNVVTPSMRLDGMNASTPQRRRCGHVTGSACASRTSSSGESAAVDDPTARYTNQWHASVSATNSPYPAAQSQLWSASLSVGSTSAGT